MASIALNGLGCTGNTLLHSGLPWRLHIASWLLSCLKPGVAVAFKV
jgi:hypothetical protein